MRHGLRNGHVRPQRLFQDVLGVAGGARPQDADAGVAPLHPLPQRGQHLLGVLQRIAPGQLVRLGQQLALCVRQDRLGGGGAAIDTQVGFHDLAGLEGRALEGGDRVAALELGQFPLVGEEAPLARALAYAPAARLDVLPEGRCPGVHPGPVLLPTSVQRRTQGRVEQRVSWHRDQLFRPNPRG